MGGSAHEDIRAGGPEFNPHGFLGFRGAVCVTPGEAGEAVFFFLFRHLDANFFRLYWL